MFTVEGLPLVLCFAFAFYLHTDWYFSFRILLLSNFLFEDFGILGGGFILDLVSCQNFLIDS